MRVKLQLVEMIPFVVMVVVECVDVGLTTISKAAMSNGMSNFVFVVYSNAFAALLLFPYIFVFQRTKRAPLTFSLLCKFFLLGLVGITVMQNCVFTGISYSSPTLASALSNQIPAFTFLLAVMFRMEKLDIRSSNSLIKIMGTAVLISGALLVIFYQGHPIFPIRQESGPSLGHDFTLQTSSSTVLEAEDNWIIGGLFLTAAGLSVSVYTILQAAVLKEYPSELSLVAFCCIFGTLQSAVIALIAERNLNAWILRPDIELVSILYSALLGTVVTFWGQAWCINKKGPVFVAMFKPLRIAIAAILGAIFLGDTLYVGSVIGSIVIAFGFYGVVWAQSKEKDEAREVGKLPSYSDKEPLLQYQRND
ncbi:EamA domain [Dillenia turbinata]|uniref:WAT1-related protein n=1 Tax=Dillenia turbinata TaxID=194707 RepID=A0AAN8YZD1_9MAGN